MLTCKDCIHFKVCDDYVPLIGRETKVACPDYKSTEDVVPRAEFEKARQVGFELGKKDNIYGHSVEQMAKKVDELSIELEAMRGAANSYKLHYEQAKQEVARDIISEFKNMVVNYMKDRDLLLVSVKNAVAYAEAELKKKYTGE